MASHWCMCLLFNVWVFFLESQLHAVLFMVVSPVEEQCPAHSTCLKVLQLITCFWKCNWSLSSFPWLVLTLSFIFPTDAPQPASRVLFWWGDINACGAGNRGSGRLVGRWGGVTYTLEGNFFPGKEKSGFKVDFGDFYCPICHPALSLPQKTISKVYVAHEALVNWGEMKIGILASAF